MNVCLQICYWFIIYIAMCTMYQQFFIMLKINTLYKTMNILPTDISLLSCVQTSDIKGWTVNICKSEGPCNF